MEYFASENQIQKLPAYNNIFKTPNNTFIVKNGKHHNIHLQTSSALSFDACESGTVEAETSIL